jgi:hypothetical protein
VPPGKTGDLQLTGKSSILQQLTNRLLESALHNKMTNHAGCHKHDPADRHTHNSHRHSAERDL